MQRSLQAPSERLPFPLPPSHYWNLCHSPRCFSSPFKMFPSALCSGLPPLPHPPPQLSGGHAIAFRCECINTYPIASSSPVTSARVTQQQPNSYLNNQATHGYLSSHRVTLGDFRNTQEVCGRFSSPCIRFLSSFMRTLEGRPYTMPSWD